MRWHSIPLSSALSEEELRCVEYFQLRSREFLLNVEDLKLPGLRSLSIDLGGTRAVAQTNTFPGRHRVKSLYLDFRHFIADKEPSRFHRIVNILANNLEKSLPIQTFLAQLKQDFLRDTNIGIRINGKDLSLKKLVDLWFNTEFFHAGRTEQVRERDEWLKVLHDDAAHQLLAWGIVDTAHTVKSLYACVKDLNRDGSHMVNCPDVRVIFRNSSA